MLTILLGLTGGIGMPMQTSINARLSKNFGTPYRASLVNFLVGTSILFFISATVRHTITIPFNVIMNYPPWILLGGALAVFFITSNILLMPKIGSVQTVILPALGQIIMGLLIEHFGWFCSPYNPITIYRIIGVVLVFSGVVIIVLAKQNQETKPKPINKETPKRMPMWLWYLLGIAAGICMASQTAINSYLGIVLNSKITASLINFYVGTIILIIINLLLYFNSKNRAGKIGGPVWMWFGGIFGCFCLLANLFVAQSAGVSIAVVVALTGMMAGGLLVDQFGLFESAHRPLNLKKILGLVIMISGTSLINLM